MNKQKTSRRSPEISKYSNPNEIVAIMEEDVVAGLKRASAYIRSWRTPPNWSFVDWWDEIQATAFWAAWQAKKDFDPAYGVPLAEFVNCRVKSCTLTRYRQEWRFALKTTSSDAEEIEKFVNSSGNRAASQKIFELLDHALGRISGMERWLLRQIFWQQRTETDIAAELHVSQPAVNKRKRAALLRLRENL